MRNFKALQVSETEKGKFKREFSRSEFINKLHEQGFFKESKTLEEVKNELEDVAGFVFCIDRPPTNSKLKFIDSWINSTVCFW